MSKNIKTTNGGRQSLAKTDSATRASAKREETGIESNAIWEYAPTLDGQLLGASNRSHRVDSHCLRLNFGTVNSKVSMAVVRKFMNFGALDRAIDENQ
ncbi:MAG: hypothetical protein ABSD67_19640 [Terracidiphilus sp.]|jgi:hypothetical protein